MRNQLQNPY